MTLLVSSKLMEGGATGDQAARISTPGAVRSGYFFHPNQISIMLLIDNDRKKSQAREICCLITLRMSAVIGLGPLEEKETTRGAATSFQVSPARMVPIG